MVDTTFSNLNDKQREAVFKTDGPVLILAGAGSGKTTVLINRVAYLIGVQNVRPYEILAITFTNKAAQELKNRLTTMLGDAGNDVFASTFHSMCVKFLRRDIDKLGYKRDFNIFDRADQLTVVKECIKELNIDDKMFQPKSLINEISRAKDEMTFPKDMKNDFATDYRLNIIADVYELYQEKLKKYNALDFDDIIMLTVKLFEENDDVLSYYQRRFKYVMVDEYQDTNHAQYRLVTLLAAGHKNICVVGDDDQSIYKFRGANIENILSFEKQYENCTVIKLEQNYRSTGNILDAANGVIKNNRGRKGKTLWTDCGDGEKISFYRATNEHDEGYYIAEQIINMTIDGYNYNDFAVLYRTNAQSRVIENMLIQNAVPYRVLGGLRFFDRKEIKDVLAYVKLINNPQDNVNFKRIINEPKRGIGAKTVSNCEEIANARGISMFDVCMSEDGKLGEFAKMMTELQGLAKDMPVSKLIDTVIEKTGYGAMLMNENTVEATTRLENIKELITDAMEFEKTVPKEEATLNNYLEKISLVADVDNYDESQEVVVLMTLHSAKGLEFPVVFMCGMEEGLFPSYMSIGSNEELEEERRLCYVGITRAKKKLFITCTQSRTLFGAVSYNKPSRFVDEIDDNLIDIPFKTEIKKEITNSYISPVKYNKITLDSKKTVSGGVTYSVGQMVKHNKFGKGMILKATAVGNDWHLEIAFDTVGTKNLMAAYAKLEIL
ncbi:MAG: UvrD-helicase domain-containing protein [Clostridia bacterium]|nr:UvrD-helicase domain-containing protein [Clostridia bacterium]